MSGRSIIGRIATWIGITVTTVIALAVAAMGACVWILTPARLTPLVCHVVSEALPDVEFGLKRAELTFWSTFPKLYIEFDSVAIESRDFPDADGRKILMADRVRGGVDVAGLPLGHYSIYDVELSGMKVNVVVLDDSVSNLTALTAGNESTQSDDTELPELSINKFDITDSVTVSYRSVTDSMHVAMTLRPARVLSETSDGYDIDIRSNVTSGSFHSLIIERLNADINGRVMWSAREPMQIGLDNFSVTVGEIPARFSTEIRFGDELAVRSGKMDVGPVKYEALLQLIDVEKFPELKKLDTDMAVRIKATLKSEYVVRGDSLPLPDVAGSVEIDECQLIYSRLRLSDLALQADFDIDGRNPDRSTLDVRRFTASGRAIATSFTGTATQLFSDPHVQGTMKLNLALSRLPDELLRRRGIEASGNVRLDASGQFRLSDLSAENFYRVDLKGRLALSDFNVAVPDSGVAIYLKKGNFGLGTHTSYKGAENRVDSLLMASLDIDTLALTTREAEVRLSGLKGGFGCENRPKSADTTAIVPLGAGLNVASLTLITADSMRLRMRGGAVSARVLRYKGDAHVPQLQLSASANTLLTTDGVNFLGLANGHVEADANKRIRRIRTDSTRHVRRSVIDTVNTIEFVDKGVRSLINRWQLTGSVKAGRGMMFTPYMPMRSRITDIDMTFSTDSVVLHSLRYNGGRSDFAVTGTIANIRRAVNRRGDLEVKCNVECDTLDVDELLHVAARGSAYADGHRSTGEIVTMDSIDTPTVSDIGTDEPLTAILIPKNIDADLDVAARHVQYANLPVNNFSGCLQMKGGAMILRNIQATSGVGAIDVSALYSAPDKNDIHFGLGMQLKKIDVRRFIELMPAIDSIMPLLGSFKGIINADIAATADVDSLMNIELPTLEAAVKLSGDSLRLLDASTFRTLKKWLRFKGSDDNQVEHMDVEMVISNSTMEIFPFVFNFDRYRLAVMGSNDLAMNFKYHVSVLKSPLPFKFGINLSGTPDKMKVRLGGAKYKDGMSGRSVALADTTRVNLIEEMQRIFLSGDSRRPTGVAGVKKGAANQIDYEEPPLTRSDSLMMIKEGLIENPDSTLTDNTKHDNK